MASYLLNAAAGYCKRSLPMTAINLMTGFGAAKAASEIRAQMNHDDCSDFSSHYFIKTAYNGLFTLAISNIGVKGILNLVSAWTLWQRIGMIAVIGAVSYLSSVQIKGHEEDHGYDPALGDFHDLHSAIPRVCGQMLLAASVTMAAEAGWPMLRAAFGKST